MRDEFEKWYFADVSKHSADKNENGDYKYMAAAIAWNIWKAAVNAEREACVKVCENFGTEWQCTNTTNEIVYALHARGDLG